MTKRAREGRAAHTTAITRLLLVAVVAALVGAMGCATPGGETAADADAEQTEADAPAEEGRAAPGRAEAPSNAAPGPDVPGFHATTVGRSDFEVLIVQYWSKGPLFRAETMVSGHPIVTLVRGDQYYCWDALTGVGYVVRRTPAALAAEAERARPFGMELQQLLDEGGERIRSETMNGVRVDVYRVTDEEGRRTLWVDADRLGLPIRLETYDRATGRTGQLDWINWIPGLKIPDAFFAPPTGIELERFDTYEAYLQRLGTEPVPPAPPLFHYLLHERGGSTG